MVDWLIQHDIDLTIRLNALWHPYLDTIMLFLSKKLVWIPLYIFIIYQIVRNYPKHYLWIITACILTICIADQTTSSLMKPLIQRLRPCHDQRVNSIIQVIGNCGGRYGFASSHAANTMGLAFFVSLNKKLKLAPYLLVWAIIVSYSRIHLGVHFVGDVLTGWIVGIIAAAISCWIYSKISSRFFDYS